MSALSIIALDQLSCVACFIQSQEERPRSLSISKQVVYQRQKTDDRNAFKYDIFVSASIL
jgi:hypothetical protein